MKFAQVYSSPHTDSRPFQLECNVFQFQTKCQHPLPWSGHSCLVANYVTQVSVFYRQIADQLTSSIWSPVKNGNSITMAKQATHFRHLFRTHSYTIENWPNYAEANPVAAHFNPNNNRELKDLAIKCVEKVAASKDLSKRISKTTSNWF